MSCSPCETSAVVHTVEYAMCEACVVEDGMAGDVNDGMDPIEHEKGTWHVAALFFWCAEFDCTCQVFTGRW